MPISPLNAIAVSSWPDRRVAGRAAEIPDLDAMAARREAQLRAAIRLHDVDQFQDAPAIEHAHRWLRRGEVHEIVAIADAEFKLLNPLRGRLRPHRRHQRDRQPRIRLGVVALEADTFREIARGDHYTAHDPR